MTTSTNASATSATTRVAPQPVLRAAGCAAAALQRRRGLGRASWIAGARPNSSAVTAVAASVNERTMRSTDTIWSRGVSAGANASNARTAAYANAMPSAPPISASRPLSTTS